MRYFYWTMALLIASTLLPSVVFFLLYVLTGIPEYGNRARGLWTVTRVLALFGFNILIWGHVGVALWVIWSS
jgi:hypothetical protein